MACRRARATPSEADGTLPGRSRLEGGEGASRPTRRPITKARGPPRRQRSRREGSRPGLLSPNPTSVAASTPNANRGARTGCGGTARADVPRSTANHHRNSRYSVPATVSHGSAITRRTGRKPSPATANASRLVRWTPAVAGTPSSPGARTRTDVAAVVHPPGRRGQHHRGQQHHGGVQAQCRGHHRCDHEHQPQPPPLPLPRAVTAIGGLVVAETTHRLPPAWRFGWW